MAKLRLNCSDLSKCHRPVRATRLGLLSIVRLFLSDSLAVQRGLSVANKSRLNAIEILPAEARNANLNYAQRQPLFLAIHLQMSTVRGLFSTKEPLRCILKLFSLRFVNWKIPVVFEVFRIRLLAGQRFIVHQPKKISLTKH